MEQQQHVYRSLGVAGASRIEVRQEKGLLLLTGTLPFSCECDGTEITLRTKTGMQRRRRLDIRIKRRLSLYREHWRTVACHCQRQRHFPPR